MAPTHAGGLVFQQRQGKTFFMIVRAKPSPFHWVIPKGHIESGESPEAAAIREIQEETGVRAKIIATLGTLHFTYQGNEINTIVYLSEYVGDTLSMEERESHWGTYEEIRSLLTFEDTRELLDLAQEFVLRKK